MRQVATSSFSAPRATSIIPARLRFNDAVEVIRPKHVLQGMIGLVEKDVEVLATVAVCPALLARSGDR
jgi:hypothetical protein